MALTPRQVIDPVVAFEKKRAEDQHSGRDTILQETSRLQKTVAASAPGGDP